jgi:hypothetical protein
MPNDEEMELDLEKPEELVRLKDVFKFTTPFWILVVSCVVVYGEYLMI